MVFRRADRRAARVARAARAATARVERPAAGGRAAGWVSACLVLAVSCGGDRTGGPTGLPEDVVRAAPDKTLAAGRARLSVASQDSFVEGTLDLATGRAQARLRSRAVPDVAGLAVDLDYAAAYLAGVGTTDDPSAISAAPAQLLAGGVQPGNPIAALDLLRGAVEVEAYGGAAVRGTSTFRYDLVINPERVLAEAPADRRPALSKALAGVGDGQIPADVWVDHSGRVRRVQFGNDLNETTTTTDRRGLPFVTSVDLYDFGLRDGGRR